MLRRHAPGWMVELVQSGDGSPLHKAPVGGFLLLRFTHLDGTKTPHVPQAIMDHRNNSIPFDKITSRDITDTHRRGACLLAALQMGLAYELWAKMPLENGYQVADETTIEKVKQDTKTATPSVPKKVEISIEKTTADEADFMRACSAIGLTESAAQSLVPKLKGDYENGIKTLADKDHKFVSSLNAKFPASPGEDY